MGIELLEFLKSIFNAPKTPAGQSAALLVAILTLVLCGPLLVNAVGGYLWPYLIKQYGVDLAPIVYVGVWLIAFPALLALLRGSLASSFGMAALFKQWAIKSHAEYPHHFSTLDQTIQLNQIIGMMLLFLVCRLAFSGLLAIPRYIFCQTTIFKKTKN